MAQPFEVFRRELGAFIFTGQDRARASVLDEVRVALAARGMHQLDVDELLVDAPNRVVRAWWGGDQVGFVQETYPGAVPVTVVNVQNDRRVFSAGSQPRSSR